MQNKTRKKKPSQLPTYQREGEREFYFVFNIYLYIYSDLVPGNSHTKRSCFIRNSFKIQIRTAIAFQTILQFGMGKTGNQHSVNTKSNGKFN